MRLILTRHGETIENSKGITQGHLPGTLSEKGIDQARKVAERLKDEQIDIIYSSDLARTADTTKKIILNIRGHYNHFMDKQKKLEKAIKEAQKDPNFTKEIDQFIKESMKVHKINA